MQVVPCLNTVTVRERGGQFSAGNRLQLLVINSASHYAVRQVGNARYGRALHKVGKVSG